MNAKYAAILAALVLSLTGACASVGNSQEHLRTAVEAQKPTLDSCYGDALERDESVAGDMALVLVVDKSDGTVRDVNMSESSIQDAQLQECVTSALVGTTLEEQPEVGLEVSYTLEFAPAS